MSKRVLPLSGDALARVKVLRPGVPPETIAKAVADLDRMVRAGLDPSALMAGLSSEARTVIDVGYDRDLGRFVVRSAVRPGLQERAAKPAHVAHRRQLVDMAADHVSPFVGGRPGSGLSRSLRDALKHTGQQDVVSRLALAMRFSGAVAPVSINSITGWETIDSDPSRAHVAKVGSELRLRNFSVVESKLPSKANIKHCGDAEGVGLFTVEHSLLAAHRKAPNSVGQTIERDVLVGVVESYSLCLRSIAEYTGVGSVDDLFEGDGKPTEEALVVAGMAVEQRDPTLAVPVSTAVVVHNFARATDASGGEIASNS